MSVLQSSGDHLTLNADGSSKNILFQADGVQKASISSAGLLTSTTIDATVLTGNLPAISGASLTGVTATDATKLPLAGGTMSGNIVMSGSETVDGVDISARDAILTSTTTNAALGVTNAATAQTTANAALPKAGGTMTGNITTEAITETQTTKSASFAPDLTNDGTIFSCTGTMTITMPTATAGKSFTIIHATATSITWGGTIEWNGGSEPTKGSGIDIYVFVSDGTNWYGNQAGTGYA